MSLFPHHIRGLLNQEKISLFDFFKCVDSIMDVYDVFVCGQFPMSFSHVLLFLVDMRRQLD